ncbi:archaeosortase/exosortase family protein [Geomonas anaerohicana]|uniref:Archaeosortase/exosortase family protein n=1 Tax=Geomonas anaerohicana TaxID=2798583 RepID=A0ABS0YB37_9BACT|nr:archaeosortase/exosortase family protein [Geomonas anaerohicana]MBJ6749132.1 archaeosortase/exosortase family protein [Geomonas anaerohicana]
MAAAWGAGWSGDFCQKTEERLMSLVEPEISSARPQRNGAVKRPVSPLITTSLLFAAFMLSLHAVLWLAVPVWKETDPLRAYTTKTVSFLLDKLNIANAVSGNTITLHNDIWSVTQECTAINVLILFVSFVLAYTSSIRAKLLAMLAGIPFIVISNLARLVTLGLLTEYFPRKAHFFHDFVWQTVFVFLVIAMWLIWIELVVKREDNHAVSR